MIPMLKLTFQSHFLPIQLAHCYLDSSFLLFLLPLESLSKLYAVPRNVTYRLSYLSILKGSAKKKILCNVLYRSVCTLGSSAT